MQTWWRNENEDIRPWFNEQDTFLRVSGTIRDDKLQRSTLRYCWLIYDLADMVPLLYRICILELSLCLLKWTVCLILFAMQPSASYILVCCRHCCRMAGSAGMMPSEANDVSRQDAICHFTELLCMHGGNGKGESNPHKLGLCISKGRKALTSKMWNRKLYA
jgi:hypothetical protein